jgi:adenine-specific DNA-methyltransferase
MYVLCSIAPGLRDEEISVAFRGKADRFPNLTIKKIPKAVLSRCEWGHDDYSLQIENLPQAPKTLRTSLFPELEEA